MLLGAINGKLEHVLCKVCDLTFKFKKNLYITVYFGEKIQTQKVNIFPHKHVILEGNKVPRILFDARNVAT